ncbi:MAG: HlyD family efflux transporter periplasmic adaptor subunit [Rhizobiales bacterium]|nr:HlyD family efflux transporter periplasmic adaptor subunit [Hyphomicrobiales bacterium]
MTIKVQRERPSHRMHHRVVAPLFVTVGGVTARARDWSLGGLSVKGFRGPLPRLGTVLKLDLCLPFQGFDIVFEAEGEVVRLHEGEQFFAVQFTELGERARELMQHFITEILRGSMVAVEDTIQRIDVPVTPVPTKPEAAPAVEEAGPSLRTLAWSGAYLALGLAVFLYVALLVYSNVFRLEVPTAVVAAPIESVRAQFEGRVIHGDVQPGQPVAAGDVLLHVADNELEKSIDLAEIKIREQEARLAFLKRRQSEELSRMEGLATVTLKSLEQIKTEVERLTREAEIAERRHQRLSGLLAKGFTTSDRIESAEREFMAARQTLASRRLELAARMQIAESGIGRRHYTGENIVGEIGEIEAEVDLVSEGVRLARSQYEALLKHRARLAVRAPFDGVVLELPRVNHGSVRQGDVVAVIEEAAARHVVAYLDQDEILKVGIGDEALAYIPALGRTVDLRVTQIDRTSGFLDEQNARYSWRAPKDRTAKVTLEFAAASGSAELADLRPGLPIVVVFERRGNVPILGEINRRISTLLSIRPAASGDVAIGPRGAASPTASPEGNGQGNAAGRARLLDAGGALEAATSGCRPAIVCDPEVREVFSRYNTWLGSHAGVSSRDGRIAPVAPVTTSRPDLVL